jgi:hypothetical protein
MHDLYIEPSRGHAHLVVSGDIGIGQAVDNVTAEILRRLQPGIRA